MLVFIEVHCFTALTSFCTVKFTFRLLNILRSSPPCPYVSDQKKNLSQWDGKSNVFFLALFYCKILLYYSTFLQDSTSYWSNTHRDIRSNEPNDCLHHTSPPHSKGTVHPQIKIQSVYSQEHAEGASQQHSNWGRWGLVLNVIKATT